VCLDGGLDDCAQDDVHDGVHISILEQLNHHNMFNVHIYILIISLLSKIEIFQLNCKQEGPKGPWVTHMRKRSKVTVEPFTEDH